MTAELPATTDLDRPGRHPGRASGAELWLFRHGEVHEDWQGKAYGGLDVPLSEGGERDTLAVAERFGALAPDLILCSTLQRARRLGDGLARATGAPLEASAGLAEIQRGRWQGLTVSELFERHAEDVAGFYADPWTFRAHGGESDQDVAARAWPVVDAGLAAVGGGRLVVAAHYNVLRVLIARALGVAPERSFCLRIDLAAANLLIDGPDGWQLERLNVRTHRRAGSPAR